MVTTTQRLGKGMIIVAWLLVLGLLTWFFNDILDNQYNPNRELTVQLHQEGNQEIILQRNYMGHYVAPGMINNTPVVFFLDTGATVVSVPEKLATQLRLERGVPLQMVTANGTVTAYSTQLDKVTLGPIELYGVRASINPQIQDNEILLGMSFLKQLEFTQRGDTLILRQLSRSGER